jgi:DNA-binding MarR family transcriptional regulator
VHQVRLDQFLRDVHAYDQSLKFGMIRLPCRTIHYLSAAKLVLVQNSIVANIVFKRHYIDMIKELEIDSRAIADLVFHLGRITSGEGLPESLTAAQWAVLRYFAQANRFSRTPSAFAAFHATTRGTASQTIKSLETQGYLTRMRSENDRRSVRLVLTEKARGILAKDPFESLVRAADSLPPSVRGQFASALQRMLGQVAEERGKPPFGTCTSCQHLESDVCSPEGQAPYACGFSSEPLLLEELEGVCINFFQRKPTVKDPVTGAAVR